MPLVAWTTLTYAAALIVALSVGSSAQLALCAATLVATLALFATGRRASASVGAIAAAATLIAVAVTSHDATCGARLARRHEWIASFDTDASRGAAKAHVAADGCSARAMVIVADGHASAGERGVVRGRATTDERGLFIEDATITAVTRGELLSMLRAATARRIDRIFRSDAAMARALVIGDMSGIPPEQRDRFARSGLVHMISVSGLHVGIIALALELLASILRLPRTPARLATLIILAGYVMAIGAPPPAVRAAVMLGALLMTRVLQRPTSPWAILALGAAAPLIDPRTALDLGWQLSVAGTAALIAGGALSKRTIPKRWKGARRSLAASALISIVATLVTAPLVAWTFGRVSLLGPLSNLLADPIMGLLQPVLFLAVIVPIAPVENFSADAAHALLLAFDGIARAADVVPGAAPLVLPTAAGAVAAGVTSIAIVVACVTKNSGRALVVALGAMSALIIEPLVPHHGVPELHMIDVGQGDAIALRTSRGRWIVIDAGRSWIGGDAGKSTVVPYLAHRGGDVALFVLSHPHSDHVGGAASLFTMLRPARFLDPGYVGTSAPYVAALAAARERRMPWQRVRPGDSLVVDDIVLTALAPDSAWTAALTDANLASSVLVARIGGAHVLFTGDAEAAEEDWLLAHSREALTADVLKVGHHGSSTSTTPAFLDAVRPRIALVSVGAHNAYGHPSAQIMEALREAGAEILRTDQLGTVVLRFRPDAIGVSANGQQWNVQRQVTR
ncbi:MAG: DNA internalization-related competence protein ComEC/Rec2 [Gemmatimonadota bacterium]